MSTNCKGSHWEGGYDYQFVEVPPDDLICKICQCPSRNPYLSVCCGHVFCKSCLDACLAASFSVVCPMCRSLQFQGFLNRQIDRKVKSLHVFCVNKTKGCQWKGEINNISNHLDEKCHFQDIHCPYHCAIIIQRHQLPHHMKHECVRRKIKCSYCHLFRGEFQYFGQHLMECLSSPLSCPNGCNNDTILRKDLETHEKVCPLAKVKCKFYKIGCTAVMARKDQVNHDASSLQHHLDLVIHDRDFILSKVTDMQNQLAGIKKTNTDVSEELAKTRQTLELTKNQFMEMNYQLAKAEKQMTAIETINGSSENSFVAIMFCIILMIFSGALIMLMFVYGVKYIADH